LTNNDWLIGWSRLIGETSQQLGKLCALGPIERGEPVPLPFRLILHGPQQIGPSTIGQSDVNQPAIDLITRPGHQAVPLQGVQHARGGRAGGTC
jgi:hypothetical protein